MTENPFDCVTYSMQHRAWKRGHAAGEVKGWNEAIEAVIKQAQTWGMPEQIAKAHFEVLRKKVSE